MIRTNRPWFGPKRIGYGLRPQTWQGWLIVLVFVAAFVLIAVLV
jgi:preprotein translocase subunit SecE